MRPIRTCHYLTAAVRHQRAIVKLCVCLRERQREGTQLHINCTHVINMSASPKLTRHHEEALSSVVLIIDSGNRI